MGHFLKQLGFVIVIGVLAWLAITAFSRTAAAQTTYYEITEGTFESRPVPAYLQELRTEGYVIEDEPIQPYDEVIVQPGTGFIQSEDGYRIWIPIGQPPEMGKEEAQ